MSQQRQPKQIAPPAPERLPAIIESLLFVAEEPQEIGTLAKTLGVPRQGVERAVETLLTSVENRGLFVQRLGDRIQLSTTPEAAPYIEHFLEVEHGHLSRASLETLAIVAYRQPVTRGMVEAVRGVNSDHAVSTLIARGLVEDVGRAPSPGRPVLFGTSIRFLEYFGLQRPEDLPPLPELVAAEGERNGAAPAAQNGADEDDDATDEGEGDDAAVAIEPGEAHNGADEDDDATDEGEGDDAAVAIEPGDAQNGADEDDDATDEGEGDDAAATVEPGKAQAATDDSPIPEEFRAATRVPVDGDVDDESSVQPAAGPETA